MQIGRKDADGGGLDLGQVGVAGVVDEAGCDVEATLSVIGGRWKPVLVCHLPDSGRSLEAILVLMQDWGSAFKTRRLAEKSEGELLANNA